ncbi:MAG: hypothetical protein ACXVA9_06540, partial [Bdellovibrionales bacterium]
MRRIFIFIAIAFLSPAHGKLCNAFKEKCWLQTGGSSSSPAYPSKNSSIRINPSAVPTDDSYGGEVLYYGNQWDFGIVKGTGRIGAAISASNGEETFFGSRALESDTDYLTRMQAKQPYPSQKISVAGAVTVLTNKRDGLNRLQLNLGVSGKYNRLTNHTWPGAGLSAIAGPFTLGYALAQDETQTDKILETNVKYKSTTMSAGIFLDSFALDYSVLDVNVDGETPARITLLTGSLFLQKWILTLAGRTEDSSRKKYDFQTQSLITEQVKHETFGGVQFALNKVLMLGIFHNYYLLRETSFGL